MDFLKLINKEVSEYDNEYITIVNSFSFNAKETIERIYRYLYSIFERGKIDAEGNRMFFFNVVRNPCKTTTKAIDFDMRHIRFHTASGGDPLRTWYMDRDFRFWAKDNGFGKVLNRIFDELPKFGTSVLKVVDNKPHFVDLRNFIVEQSADSLDGANYIIEKHLYTPIELRRVGAEMGWENIDEAIEEHRKMGKPYITVYERYGEIEDPETGEFAYKRIIHADVGVDETLSNGETIAHPGITFDETEVETHPYWEFHLEKIPGRWLGVGIPEMLFDTQIYENVVSNLEAKGAYWASMRAFQTRDESINRNLKTDVRDGEVLAGVEDEITEIRITAGDMGFFTQQHQKWMQNRDELTFAYEVMRGERLPAGTPLGSARLAAGMAGGYFDQIRENIALDIKEFLYKVIIPRFQKEQSREHTLRLVGQDLDKFNELLASEEANKALLRYVANNAKIPSSQEYDILRAMVSEKVKQKKERLVKIPKDFYKNIKYKIDIIITGEQKDTTIFAQTLFAALQAVTADPTLLHDPTKKKFFYKWLEAGGLYPADFEAEQTMPKIGTIAAQQRGAGGGVSKPTFMPVTGQQEIAERRL